jgi:acetoin utilization deacetylase AcuC-like enzyme
MDPLANMRLSIDGYAHLVETVMEVADAVCHGKLVAVLEGGYHLDVLAHSVLSTLRVLSGSEHGPSDPFGPSPRGERDTSALLDALRNLHRIKEPPYYSI